LASDKVTIRFESKALTCRADTTVAVALWENGVRHLSHSPKYGRPRGVTCARSQCTDCLMRVDGVPNIRVCEMPVRPDMEIQRQDAGAFYGPPMQKTLTTASSLFPVGFYYKWFTKPASLSRLFLRFIRPLTGVGRLPAAESTLAALPAPGGIAPQQASDLGQVDTVVVGGGPSGLQAALAASGQVLILDEHDQPGGQRRAALAAVAAHDGWLDRFPVLAAAQRRCEDLVHSFAAERANDFQGGTRAVAGFAPGGLLLRRGQELQTVRCSHLVWAAGGLDTLGLFPGNDAAGIIGPRALYRLVMRDGLDLQDRHVLVTGGGLDFWLSAALLASRGARVTVVVTESGWHSEVSAAVDLKWQLNTGLALASMRDRGQQGIEATYVPGRAGPGSLHAHLNLEADLAVVCGRGKPAYDIPYQLGADLSLQPELGGYLPRGASTGDPAGVLPGNVSVLTVGEAAGLLPADQVANSREETAS